jgi:hypothetical protein
LSLSACKQQVVNVVCTNPSDSDRIAEVIEVDASTIQAHLEGIDPAAWVVSDQDGTPVVSQLIEDAEGAVQKLIFQVDLTGQETKTFSISEGVPASGEPKVFGRHVPERKDDFAWENDRIAFRMYGQELERTEMRSSGIDVWVKSTESLVVDKWFAGNDYHTDHGEGCDYYKVGPTLGAGGIAPYMDSIYMSHNWETSEVLESGPIRLVFELGFDTWEVPGGTIKENRIITLDAGSHLNRVDISYETDLTFDLAIGIHKRPEGDEVLNSDANAILAFWEPPYQDFGQTGIGAIVPEKSLFKGFTEDENHYLMIAGIGADKQFTYYVGAGWSKSDWFDNGADWFGYMEGFADRLANPVKVEVK